MVKIQNKRELMENGRSPLDKKARGLALNALEAALKAADPRVIIKSKVRLKGNTLQIGEQAFNLGDFKNIYVVGGGKASGAMAEALEEVLGDRVTNGTVNILHGTSQQFKTQRIRLHEAGHPVPDEAGVEGTQRILDMADRADEKDLLICLISGGGSSLMPCPRGEITLSDKRRATEALLRSGATINEFNTVRKHISDFKGGWLAKRAYPATVVSLLLSDVVGDPLDVIASGPTVPDTTTFRDAIWVLKKYGLWDQAPESVRKTLLDGEGGILPETPKADDATFKRVHNVVVGNVRSAGLAALNQLRNGGLHTFFLTASMEGEARHVGAMFASIAREIEVSGNPVSKPAGIVIGGETTVTVTGKGRGGRNQEIALGAALKLRGLDGVVVASINTDGLDGPTDAAGALADGKTIPRSQELNLKAEDFLINNDSYSFFSKLGDLIFTGPTGTNVNDISVIVVM
ncbi:MAG: glycerate kinase [Candidatus Bathyarchaeia archaeon]